jgi:hypothetical protein
MTKEEIRQAAQDWDGSEICTASEEGAFVAGAEWMQEKMIEKSVEWLREEMYYRDESSGRGCWGVIKVFGTYDSLEEFINEFKQAMQDESK